MHSEATVEVGTPIVAADGWVLVVDPERRPLGWIDGARHPGPVTTELLTGGTLAPAGGSLRAALDASLSSPSGRGVVIDDEGRLAGTVTAEEVLRASPSGVTSPSAAAP